jgi:hypothetical protein
MTDDKIALRDLLEKGSDATLLREMIGFAAQRLMELEAEGLCGAGHGERSPRAGKPAQGVDFRFVEHRVGDKRIIRLLQKWLRAGILEDGTLTVSDRGTGQGSVASPLLANIYLHYALDLWAERWRRREATGDMIIVRYADDVVAGFEHEDDARRFLDAMRTRFEEFALSLHPDKTRLIEFGRHAAANRAKSGLGKPDTLISWVSPSSAARHAAALSSSRGRPGATACGQRSKK